MAGHWKGEHDGGTWEEIWTSDEGGLITGTAKLVVDGKCVFHEFSRITQRGSDIVLEVRPMGRDATEFVYDPQFRWGGFMPRRDGSSLEPLSNPEYNTKITYPIAIFRNPTHDYPRVIRYERVPRNDGVRLEALLSGVENGIEKSERIVMRPMPDRLP